MKKTIKPKDTTERPKYLYHYSGPAYVDADYKIDVDIYTVGVSKPDASRNIEYRIKKIYKLKQSTVVLFDRSQVKLVDEIALKVDTDDGSTIYPDDDWEQLLQEDSDRYLDR